MKNLLLFIILLTGAVSCQKKEYTTTETPVIDSTKIIDSINAVRTKINDSIRNTNRFPDFSGSYGFGHNLISKTGTVTFKKTGRDEYDVKGEARSGKNYITIRGTAERVSLQHLNFTGKISQSIQDDNNGKVYTRSGTNTFMTKDGGKTWRLQNMVNSAGFVDHIDIIRK